MIIGITGTIGAGKGTVVEYLKDTYGFAHYSVRDILSEEIEKRGMEPTRPTMQKIANDLRATYGPGYMAEQLYARAAAAGGNAVIESLRTLGEIETLRNKGDFFLLAVDADPRIRYERIAERKSSTDHVTFEQFIQEEEDEMQSDDPTRQNLKGCITAADVVLENNGTKEELHVRVDAAMEKIKY